VIATFQIGSGGFASDLDGMDAADPLWSDVRNMRFTDGYMTPVSGHSALYDPPSNTPYQVFPLRTSTGTFWVYLGLTSAYAVSSAGTQTNISNASAFTATADTQWTGGTLSGWLIANNENDQPQGWNGNTASDFVNLTGWNSAWRAKAIRPLREYIVGVGITKSGTSYGQMVKWSASAVPGALPSSWDEADTTKDAGEQDIGDADGPLVDIVPLGDLGIIYAANSYHAMQWTGGTYVWRFTRLSGDAGLLATNCATSFPGGHVCLTAGDVITHAGGLPRSIINGRNRKRLFNSIDATNFRRSFVQHNEQKSEIWVCYPEQGASSCTKALIWNYAQDSWAERDLPNVAGANSGPVSVTATPPTWTTVTGTWDEQTGAWDATDNSIDAAKRRLVLASVNGALYLPESGSTFNGTPANSYAERTGLSLGDPDAIKLVKSVRPRVDAPAGTTLNIRIGGAMTADGSVTWSAPLPYVVGQSEAAYGFATGRYIGLRVEGMVGDPWRVRSLDVEFERIGK
jgi:hypothetical protein